MEPIVVIAIIGLAVFIAAICTIEYIWEKKYIKEHFTFEKEDVLVVKKHEISDMTSSKKFDYFIDAEVDGQKASYNLKQDIYDQLEEGKKYCFVVCRQKIIELKS